MADAEIIDIHCRLGSTWAAPHWGDAAQVQSALTARGIGTAFLASDLARRYDPIAGNEQVAEAVNAHPGLRGWLVAHPARAQDAHAQMRRFLYSDRFVGCALYPDPLTGKPITLRAAHDLLNAFRRFAKPLLIEVDSADGALQAGEIARETSGLKVIVSGMGGDDWREAVDVAARHLNLYLDISGVLAPDKLDYALSALNGVRKLVYGSRAPAADPAAVLGLLDDIDLSADDRARLLSGNAARLFGLDAEAEAAAADLAPQEADRLVGQDADTTVYRLEALAPDE